MLKSLIRIRDTVDNETENTTDPPVNWIEAEKLRDALAPPAGLTTKMQAVQYVYGDFMRDLSDCLGHLEGLYNSTETTPNGHAENIKVCLNARMLDLRKQPVVLAALYMDPRYHSSDGPQFFTEEEKEVAIVSISWK